MIRLATLDERKIKRCHYCETWMRVKYRIHTEKLDRVYYGMNGYVYCCGKCAKKHCAEIEN